MSTIHPWDRLPSMLLVLDTHGQARQVNRTFTVMTGQTTQEALRGGWRSAFSPASCEALMQRLGDCRDFILQLRMRYGDGRDAWVDCAARWQDDTAEYVCLLHDVSAEKDAELSARSQAELFRLLADNLPVLIAYYEASEFRCVFANRRYAQTFGFDAQSIIGKTSAEVIGAEVAAQIQPKVTLMLQKREPIAYERQITAAGAVRWLDVNMLPHVDADGKAAGAFVLIADITRRRLDEQALRESEDRLSKFMQATAEGILFHKEGVIVDVNPPLAHLLGYTFDELRGKQALAFVAPEHVARAMAVMASNRDTSYESMVVDKNGNHIAVELIVRSMTRNGERTRMVIVRDIRDRHAAQARIQHLAHHDSLTGLPNRPSFMEQLQHLLASSRESDANLALLFIDLDHFKQVNDSLGHETGDRLLQTVASRLKECLRATDLVARFGGDEFVVLLHDMARTEDVERVVRKLLVSLEVTVEGNGHAIAVTPSIGIAMRPAHGNTADELIRRADIAMYRAKAAGRAGSRFFEPAMEAAAEGSVQQAVNPPARGASGDGALPAGS